MSETAIAYGESGVGKTTICISLAKMFYELTGLTTRLISSEGWGPVENEGLIATGIVSAFNISARETLLADMRKLSRGYWPKILEEEIPVNNEDGIQVGSEIKKVRRIREDKEALAKVGLYFIETMDGIGDRFMSYIIQKETIEYNEFKKKMTVKAIGPQGSSGRYEEDGEVMAGNSEGHFGVVQKELYNLATAFNGLGGNVQLIFWTSHLGIGKMGKDGYKDKDGRMIRTGEKVYCPLLVGEAKNSQVPSWMGECFHLEDSPRIYDEMGNMTQDKVVRAYYESHREGGMMEGPRYLAKSRVGISDIEALQDRFPGGFVQLGKGEGEGLDQYYRWLLGRKGNNVKVMKTWKDEIDAARRA